MTKVFVQKNTWESLMNKKYFISFSFFFYHHNPLVKNNNLKKNWNVVHIFTSHSTDVKHKCQQGGYRFCTIKHLWMRMKLLFSKRYCFSQFFFSWLIIEKTSVEEERNSETFKVLLISHNQLFLNMVIRQNLKAIR